MIISPDIADELEALVIDEQRNHVLTKILKTKAGISKKESDHHAIISKFSFKWNKRIHTKRIEMYNLKNPDCQKVFKDRTSYGDSLSSIFDTEKDLDTATKLFMKKLDNIIKSSFKKIRVTEKSNKEIDELFNRRRELRGKTDEYSRAELERVETKLADLCAEVNYKKIKDEISNIKCEEGGINSGHLWKLKKKLNPKCRDPPTAMMDPEGNLITTPHLIQNLALDVFKNRLKNRPMKEELHTMKKNKEMICKI